MHILQQHEISQFPKSNRDSDKGLLALGTQPERSPNSGGHFMKYWGGGASARGHVTFICPCHCRGVRGHAPTGKL